MTKIMSHAILFVVILACWIAAGSVVSTDAVAAQWLAPAAADRVNVDWVKQIEADLTGNQFRDVFMAIPADPPIPAILHLLNNAAKALADNKKEYAQIFINDTIRILDNGVSKGWYGPADIEPVKAMIRKRAEAALEGKAISHATNPRWSGYTDNKPLGLTNALGEKQQNYQVEAVAPSDNRAK